MHFSRSYRSERGKYARQKIISKVLPFFSLNNADVLCAGEYMKCMIITNRAFSCSLCIQNTVECLSQQSETKGIVEARPEQMENSAQESECVETNK